MAAAAHREVKELSTRCLRKVDVLVEGGNERPAAVVVVTTAVVTTVVVTTAEVWGIKWVGM